MKKRILALLTVFALVLAAFSGCAPQQETETPDGGEAQPRKPQVVVAFNPILVFGDGSTDIAFNDVKNAMSADREAASLTSLADTTAWTWAYKLGEDWKQRGIYGMAKWRNGASVSTDNLNAYSFSNDGTISLMPYTTQASALTTYQGETPAAAGLLLSVAGTEEESLCYQFTQDATLGFPTGKITAIESVGGVKTGFLAEDNTERSAVVKFVLNTREIWAGELCNSTAGEGTAVTELEYPELAGLTVHAGDMLFMSVKLDATYNREEDVGTTTPTPPASNPTTPSNPTQQPTGGNATGSPAPSTPAVTEIPLLDGYDSHFEIVYPKGASVKEKQIAVKLRESMVGVFEADVTTRMDNTAVKPNELLVGLTDRPESQRAYNDLRQYRVNNGADFIIRMDGTKLVIAGGTESALQAATDYFMKNYCKTDRDKLASNLSYAHRPQLSTILLDGANIASYTIRTEKYPSLMTVKAAQTLVEYVVNKTGYQLKIEKDTTTTKNEILLGLTTRSGISAETFKSASLDLLSGKRGDKYTADDFRMFFDGGKLFLEAGSDYAAGLAVRKLIEQLEKSGSVSSSLDLRGSYQKGEYTLLDDYAYTWGDEFLSSAGSSFSSKNWKVMEKGYTEAKGPWYRKNDPYYLASKASLEDDDPTNDFGGPWLPASDDNYVQEGLIHNLGSNAVIRDNLLVQTARKEADGYSSSYLCTDGKMEFRYGILEARLIAATGNGGASGFWTRSKDAGDNVVNEIDIIENFGKDYIRSNLHTWASEAQGGHTNHGAMIQMIDDCYPAEGEHFYDTFHHLAVEWTPDFLNMYLDGELYLSQEISSDTWFAFRETTYVILQDSAPGTTYAYYNPGNMLAGGDVKPNEAACLFDTNGDGVVNVNDFCIEQSVDFVRLYQLNSRQYSLKAKK